MYEYEGGVVALFRARAHLAEEARGIRFGSDGQQQHMLLGIFPEVAGQRLRAFDLAGQMPRRDADDAGAKVAVRPGGFVEGAALAAVLEAESFVLELNAQACVRSGNREHE